MSSPQPTLDTLPPPPRGRTGWPWTVGAPPTPPHRPDGTPWPSVAVITPSYNQGPYLEETIRSILLQGYPALSLWVMDGGSDDESVSVIERYAPWLAGWRSGPDDGQADAVRRGIAASDSAFVAWQNSDDTYEPGAVAAAMAAADGVDVVYSDCHWIDEESRRIGVLQTAPFSLEAYLFQHIVPNQTAFIRRAAWEAVGGFDPGLHYVMEEDLWLKLGIGHRFRRIDGVWGSFRIFRRSKSGGRPDRFYGEYLKVLDRFFARDDVPPAVRAVRQQVYAKAHLIGACRLFTGGRAAEGRDALAAAIAAEPAYAGARQVDAIATLAGWARYPVVTDPVAFLETAFDHLPPAAAGWRRERAHVLAALHVERLFAAHHAGNTAATRRHFRRAVRLQPGWLRNRGVVKVGLRAHVGR